MGDIERGQVKRSAAEVYDKFFVPALFADWPELLIEAARIEAGYKVLDVACGTGVLALQAWDRVGVGGSVVGLDANAGMLAIARAKQPTLDWRHGQAEDLPFRDDEFDAVVSQFGLMFFDDKQQAIREMVRVLKPSGWLAVAVWDTLENTPGYAAVSAMLADLFGQQAADSIRVPYNLGNRAVLQQLFQVEGILNIKVTTHQKTARFPSLERWMYTDVNGWTLAGELNEQQFGELVTEAKVRLSSFVQGDGTIRFDAPAHIVTAQKDM